LLGDYPHKRKGKGKRERNEGSAKRIRHFAQKGGRPRITGAEKQRSPER